MHLKKLQFHAPAKIPSQSSKGAGYIVREGDSLWKIAKANHTTISQLMETNDLKSEEIQKGDKLLIVKMVS